MVSRATYSAIAPMLTDANVTYVARSVILPAIVPITKSMIVNATTAARKDTFRETAQKLVVALTITSLLTKWHAIRELLLTLIIIVKQVKAKLVQ